MTETGGRKVSKYILFMQKHMKEVKAQNPDMPQKEIMKKVAEMYRAQKAQVNPAAEPTKAMISASKKLADKSPTNALTKPVSASKPASKSATKSASKSATKSATKSKTATKSATK